MHPKLHRRQYLVSALFALFRLVLLIFSRLAQTANSMVCAYHIDCDCKRNLL